MSYARFPGIKVFSSFIGEVSDYSLDGIAYLNDSIIVGVDGLKKFLSSRSSEVLDDLREGRFWLAYKRDESYIICTDDCGQDVVFYYNIGPVWAVSNSFMALVEHLTANGIGLHLNSGAINSFFISHSFGESLISNNTVVQEVKVLPRNKQVKICGGKLSVEIRYFENSSKECVEKDFPDLDVINNDIVKWSSRLRALLKSVGEQRVSVDVTGGIDSRLLLGLLLKSGADKSKVCFSSNPSWEDDYRVAELLADKYSFLLNNSAGLNRNPGRLTGCEQFELYGYSSLGVYHKAYFSRFRERLHKFKLHGGGGELLREYYTGGFLSFIGRFERFFRNRSEFLSVKYNYLSCLESRDYSLANEHYADFRCRFHFGRGWYKSNESYLITPLLSSRLIQEYLSLSDLARSRRYLHLAYYLLVDPSILDVPFDDPRKSFSRDDVECMREFISNWDFSDSRDSLEMEVFIGDAPEVVAYQWGERDDASVDQVFEFELKQAEESPFVRSYLSRLSNTFLPSISEEENSRKRYRKSSLAILLKKLEGLGVVMSV